MIFKHAFTSRFSCGWIAGMFYLLILCISRPIAWWIFMPASIIIYLGFGYIAFKYLDE